MTDGEDREMIDPERVGMLRVWAAPRAAKEARTVVLKSILVKLLAGDSLLLAEDARSDRRKRPYL